VSSDAGETNVKLTSAIQCHIVFNQFTAISLISAGNVSLYKLKPAGSVKCTPDC